MRIASAMIAVIVVAVFIVVAVRRGVRVEVVNVGSTELTDVAVEVHGETQQLGDIAPGESETVKVQPTGPTKRVQLTWKSGDSEGYGRHDVQFDENGFHGTVHIELDGISVKKHEDDVRPGWF